ncbi:MAG: hypothetical protein KF901_09965 [Myxococcales bacterium]|nr:hypothetical protein [Myxococcales bacterium]
MRVDQPRLVESWWHGTDAETAIECLRAALEEHGLADALPEEEIRASAETEWTGEGPSSWRDEEQLRRHQLGIVAVHVNAELERRGDPRRFRSFGVPLRDEPTEPVWLLVTPEEHAELLAIGGPPCRIEAPYDQTRSVAELPPIVLQSQLDLDELDPSTAHRLAKAAFDDERFEDVLVLIPLAVQDGDHGLLAQLLRIDTLRALGRTDEARAAWNETADEWLEGQRRVWDTQWDRLAALHEDLGMGPDDRIERVRAR